MLDPKIGFLEKLPIFQGLSCKQFASIAKISTKAYFQPGDNLIARDEPGQAALLIMTGRAMCLDFPPASKPRADIGPGTLVGELAMLVEMVHSFTVQATERVRAMVIHRAALRHAMAIDPAIGQQLSDNLLVRLQKLAHDLRRFDRLLAQAETSAVSAGVIRPATSHAPVSSAGGIVNPASRR